jgi:hypothetical protein
MEIQELILRSYLLQKEVFTSDGRRKHKLIVQFLEIQYTPF